MQKFDLYEDQLYKYWKRYFYLIEAETIEDAVKLIKSGKVEHYDTNTIEEYDDYMTPENNNGRATIEIYDDEGALLWDNSELINRGEIITQDIRNISENLSLIMEGEPESFISEDIALSTIVKVMENLGWKFCEWDGLDTNGCDIDYRLYFIKDEKDFSYKVKGNIYFGGVKIEKCEKHYEK